MLLLIAVVGLTILISANCSLFKAVLYSTRMGTLEAEKSGGVRQIKARKMIDLKRDNTVPLSAVLILDTLAKTAGGTIAGMYAYQSLGAAAVPSFCIAFTLGVIFVADIIPKTVGVAYWRSIWPSVIWPLTLMKFGLYPLILITQKLSKMLTRHGETTPSVTEDDILGTIQLGAKHGEISPWESLMIHNIIQLETRTVREIMTPRTVIFSLDESTTVADAFEEARKRGHTRIPVYQGDRENVVGYIMMHELSTAKILEPPETPISTLRHPVSAVPETINCLVLLTEFLKTRRHIAVVWDDYGGLAGLVTLEDLIETVLGAEIVDENDSVVDLQKLARNRLHQRFFDDAPESGKE